MQDLKAVIFDGDGMTVVGERFSARLEKEHGIPLNVTARFFKKEFQDCLVGKADLKTELEMVMEKWGWKKSVDELLQFWFDAESNPIDRRFDPIISALRSRGVRTFLATNNEIYRTRSLAARLPRNWFDDIFSSARVGAKKPDASFFENISNTARLLPGEVLFWDDDEDNVSGAAQYGLTAERYTDFENFEKEMSRYIS